MSADATVIQADALQPTSDFTKGLEMPLGEFVETKPVSLKALQADLSRIGDRLSLLEAAVVLPPTPPAMRPGFYFVDADPAAAFGADGDGALHTGTGDIWRKSGGAWANTGFSVWGPGE